MGERKTESKWAEIMATENGRKFIVLKQYQQHKWLLLWQWCLSLGLEWKWISDQSYNRTSSLSTTRKIWWFCNNVTSTQNHILFSSWLLAVASSLTHFDDRKHPMSNSRILVNSWMPRLYTHTQQLLSIAFSLKSSIRVLKLKKEKIFYLSQRFNFEPLAIKPNSLQNRSFCLLFLKIVIFLMGNISIRFMFGFYGRS